MAHHVSIACEIVCKQSVAYGNDVIISEWFLDYTHTDWGKRTYDQVSVQKWQEGKVV